MCYNYLKYKILYDKQALCFCFINILEDTMLKIPENKTRKRFRIAQCVFYALLVFLCSMPFIQGATTDGHFYSYSVLDLMSFIGGESEGVLGEAFLRYVMFTPIIIIIPIIGFFFCVLDRERNMKNIVSLICCAAGIVSILTIAGTALSLGALLSLLIYLLVSFLTTIAIFARFTEDKDSEKKNNK